MTTKPKERPILFSAPMVRAILEGRKTQTRRIVKPQPWESHWKDFPTYRLDAIHRITSDGTDLIFRHSHCERGVCSSEQTTRDGILCPYGTVGDRLWVREEHYRYGHWEPVPGVKTKGGRMKWKFVADKPEVLFEAPAEYRKGRHHKDPHTPAWHKRLARFMPRWASRITLEVTGVRVERLQDISEEDAKAEGVELTEMVRGHRIWHASNRAAFCSLWQVINGIGSWDANPWVWVVEFKRVTP